MQRIVPETMINPRLTIGGARHSHTRILFDQKFLLLKILKVKYLIRFQIFSISKGAYTNFHNKSQPLK